MGATTPTAGDLLLLVLSEDVQLAAGTLLTNEDVQLSSGSLGNVTVAPRMRNPRTVEVTLGAGVSLVPGTTTLDLSASNDVVQDLTGKLATPEPGPDPAIARGDGDDPSIGDLTLSGVHRLLNGTGPAGGTLQTPATGFTVDVTHGDPSSPIDASRTIVAINIGVSVDGLVRSAGTNLADALILSGDANSSSFVVPGNVQVPTGPATVTVYVFDQSGMISAPATFSFQVRVPDDASRPFETTTNPSQQWYLDFARDVESYSVNLADSVTPVQVIPGSSGQADLEELFLQLGLLSVVPIPNVQGSQDSNTVALNRFKNEVVAELQSLHQGVNVTFTLTDPGLFPPAVGSIPYNSFSYSQICIAGSESTNGSTGVHGVALFDRNNLFQDDNCQTDFQGIQRLGVFLHTVINHGFRSSPASLFRLTYDPFSAARGGLPIGGDVADGQRLIGAQVDARSADIDLAIRRMARFAAVITAHECGHSVGLVANNPMPQGLYGNDPVNFPVFPTTSADGHIKMPSSLFPGASENIMTPAFSFDAALAPETRFNSLNLAYLREQVVQDN